MPVLGLAFSPDGSFLAVGAVNERIRLLDRATGRERTAFGRGYDPIREVAFTPDGNVLIAVSMNGLIQLWDIPQQRERATLHLDSDVCCGAFTPDRRFLATGGHDGTVRVWDLGPSLTAGVSTGSMPHPDATRR
jgi:WD40 repeat protein